MIYELQDEHIKEFLGSYGDDLDRLEAAIDEIYMPCMDEKKEINEDRLALRERDHIRAFDGAKGERPLIEPKYAVLNLEAFALRHRMSEKLTRIGSEEMQKMLAEVESGMLGLTEAKGYIRLFDNDEKKNFSCALWEEIDRKERIIGEMEKEGWIYSRSSSINYFSSINGHIFGESDRLFFTHKYEKGRYIPDIEFKSFDEVSSFLQKIRLEHEIETESRNIRQKVMVRRSDAEQKTGTNLRMKEMKKAMADQ